MTLPSIPFLWKQFNGPQIVGITKGILGFIKSRFDSWMSYFWDFSIETMNSEHLSTAGALVSFALEMRIRDHNLGIMGVHCYEFFTLSRVFQCIEPKMCLCVCV